MQTLKCLLSLLLLGISIQSLGQNTSYFKTTNKKNKYYIYIQSEFATVFRMGIFYDKSGTGSSISQQDTLILTGENEYRNKNYSLQKNKDDYTLITSNGREYKTIGTNQELVLAELNNAYWLQSHLELSSKLRQEFPFYHFFLGTAFSTWKKNNFKTSPTSLFIEHTNVHIAHVYDSICKQQSAYTKTNLFIITNSSTANYPQLKDSLSTLPKQYSKYFKTAVYSMVKSNPEYFFKIVQDFESDKEIIYWAIDKDKELVKKIKQVRGYDSLKKEFIKNYRSGRAMPFKIIGAFTLMGALISWLIIAQP